VTLTRGSGIRLVALLAVALSALILAVPAHADVATFRCVVTVGSGQTPADLTGTIGTDASAGGCLLVTLGRASTVTAAAPAPGCHLEAATTPNGGFDSTANVGQTLPAGSRIWARCAAGVVQAANTVTLDDGTRTVVAPGWSAPSTVTVGNLAEPIVTGAADGTLYYSPHNRLFRSIDGGGSWDDISPPITDALPTPFSDTTVSVAPDGTVWWARNWGSLDSTLACVSSDRGEQWRCNNNAIGGITDRMWLSAISGTEALLESSHGAQQPEWTRTTDGGTTYVPYATTAEHGSYGNIVRDGVTGAAWQAHVENSGGAPLHITRVDPSQGPVLTSVSTPIERADGLPVIGYADGMLWASGEPRRPDGSRGLTISRSGDGGQTWTTFTPSQPAASVVLSAVAAAPGGQVLVTYYGSDVAAAPQSNGGHWSVYAARTANGNDPNPTWTVTPLVADIHVGSLCWYFGCEQAGGDAHGRVVGDFQQPWLDGDGIAHVAYARDGGNGVAWAQYTESSAPSPPPTVPEAPLAAVLVVTAAVGLGLGGRRHRRAA
jgi:hypothetical protein